MEQFVIEGGHTLSGTITASGNKNAVLKMLAACIMTDQPVILHNVPEIADVRTTMAVMEDLGVDLTQLDANSWQIHAKTVRTHIIDRKLGSKIRSSIVFAGPMLARLGKLELPPPGGDIIGRRRVDTHFLALQALGASYTIEDVYQFTAKKLVGTDILLDEASVTATENALMAASLAQGTTVLRNAASEPHVQELCHFLNTLGANIENIGSNTLIIHGVEKLGGGEFTIGADFMEVGSFIGAAAITGGKLRIEKASPEYLPMVELVYNRLGVHWEVDGDAIIVPENQEMTIIPDLGNAIPTIKAQPWPAFPSDLMSIALVIATQSEGTVLFHEWMYDSRFFWVDKLVFMGARVVLCDPHRCIIQGQTELRGEKNRITSPDIRAGMALVLAALCAKGTTIIRNIGQIDRGYERVEQKLQVLGARIERVYEN